MIITLREIQRRALETLMCGSINRYAFCWEESVIPDAVFMHLADSTDLVILDEYGNYTITENGRRTLGARRDITMTTPLEKNITKTIIKRLNALQGCKVKKFHGSAWGEAELDIYGCYQGRAVFIEVKRPGGKPTARQESIIRDWESVGAITGTVTSADEAEALVEKAF